MIEAKRKSLRENLQGIFAISYGFRSRDEELIFNLCEQKIIPYIQKITHIALFPYEIELIREMAERTGENAPLEDDSNYFTPINRRSCAKSEIRKKHKKSGECFFTGND